MTEDSWNINDKQIFEMTGKNFFEWIKTIDIFTALRRKTYDVVSLLQEEYDVPEYWARIIATHYLEHKENIL